MKTSELSGAALDWAVAKCEGMYVRPTRGGWFVFDSDAYAEFRNDYNDDNDYQDWSVALTTEVVGVTLGIAYSDTTGFDERVYCVAPFQCGSQFIASVSKSF